MVSAELIVSTPPFLSLTVGSQMLGVREWYKPGRSTLRALFGIKLLCRILQYVYSCSLGHALHDQQVCFT